MFSQRIFTTFVFLMGLIGFINADFDIYWRDYTGNIPSDAVPAGNGLLIGQVIYEGFLTPGGINPRTKTFSSEYYGKFEATKHIKILCTGSPKKITWKKININNIPKDLSNILIEGGFQNQFSWYIGRVFYQGEWKIGKVDIKSRYFKGLNVWNRDDSYKRMLEFDVLTYT